MILNTLRSNSILSLVFPVILCAAIWVGVTVLHGYSALVSGAPLFDSLWGWILKLPALSVTIGFGLVYAEAYIWRRFINDQALLNQSSNMPAIFYMLLFSCRPVQVGFYPALAASPFLILAVIRLAAAYKKEKALSEAFDAGFLIGIAALLYLPALVFLLFVWIALPTLRSISWREWIISLTGFAMPLFLAYAWLMLFVPEYNNLTHGIIDSIGTYHPTFKFSWQGAAMVGTVGIIVISSFLFFIQTIGANVVKKQKIWGLMLWFLIFAIVAGALSPQQDSRSYSLAAIPCSFIFSNYFLRSKSPWLPDLLFIILLAAIGINIFYA